MYETIRGLITKSDMGVVPGEKHLVYEVRNLARWGWSKDR
jgi:hypothetical protein